MSRGGGTSNGGVIGKTNKTSFGKNTITSKTSTGDITTQPGTGLAKVLVLLEVEVVEVMMVVMVVQAVVEPVDIDVLKFQLMEIQLIQPQLVVVEMVDQVVDQIQAE